eukprot:TRINITY_DN1139_c0_g1_i1.p1 TRINITY_DN1139_c0_g1~~TRINITY_DN1139_c0_g1_i1.p1  ORF type:complete len:798 (-),score=257.68 TRINITY_DN1139_c0_g1_i1:64-2364(-)
MSSRAARRYMSLLEEQRLKKQLEEEEEQEQEQEQEEEQEEEEQEQEEEQVEDQEEQEQEVAEVQEEEQEEQQEGDQEEGEEEQSEISSSTQQKSNRRKRRKRRGKKKIVEQQEEVEEEKEEGQQQQEPIQPKPLPEEEHDVDHKASNRSKGTQSQKKSEEEKTTRHVRAVEKSLVDDTRKKKKNKKNRKKVNDGGLNDADDIDKLVASIEGVDVTSDKKEGKKESNNGNEGANETCAIELVDVKCLDELVELKRIFGPDVISHADRDAPQQQRLPHQQRKSKGLSRRATSSSSSSVSSRNLFVKPSRNWPPTSQIGIGMEVATTSARGVVLYRITWNKEYRENQSRYQRIQQTHDINAIAQLLMFVPYHVDSLLQLAEVLKQTGEYQEAESLIARCLHAYQSSCHHSFTSNLLNSRARMSFGDHEENRGFFFTLFRHIQMLGRKGCYRTATEYCKVLYSLDHLDPLSVAFLIDYYALSSKQYRLVVEFSSFYYARLQSILGESPIILMNLSYSTALALFLISESDDCSLIISGQEINPREASIQKLEEALMLFPMVLPELVKKCGSSSSFRDTDGTQLNQHSFFTSSSSSPGLDTLSKLFIERHYALWQPSSVQTWLKNAASRVVRRAKDDSLVQTLKTVREQHYPVNSRIPFFRNLHFSEYSDVVPTLPQNMAQELMNNNNPLQDQIPVQFHENPGMFVDQQLPPDLQNQNPLWLFLRTLLPVPLPDPQEQPQQQQGIYEQLLHFLGRDNQNQGDDYTDSDSDDD